MTNLVARALRRVTIVFHSKSDDDDTTISTVSSCSSSSLSLQHHDFEVMRYRPDSRSAANARSRLVELVTSDSKLFREIQEEMRRRRTLFRTNTSVGQLFFCPATLDWLEPHVLAIEPQRQIQLLQRHPSSQQTRMDRLWNSVNYLRIGHSCRSILLDTRSFRSPGGVADFKPVITTLASEYEHREAMNLRREFVARHEGSFRSMGANPQESSQSGHPHHIIDHDDNVETIVSRVASFLWSRRSRTPTLVDNSPSNLVINVPKPVIVMPRACGLIQEAIAILCEDVETIMQCLRYLTRRKPQSSPSTKIN